MLSVLTMADCTFIITGLQYFLSSYMTVALQGDEATVNLLFSVTLIAGPIVGVLLATGIISRILDDYAGPKTVYLCLFLYILLICACIPAPLADNYIVFIVLIWLIIIL